MTLLLTALLQDSCKRESEAPVDPESPLIKRYQVNQRFSIQLKEEVEVIDSLGKEQNPVTGAMEYPVYKISFDSVLNDDRAFGKLCENMCYGWVGTLVSATKFGNKITDSFEYFQ